MLTHRTKNRNSRWQGQTTYVSATTYTQFVELDNQDFRTLLHVKKNPLNMFMGLLK